MEKNRFEKSLPLKVEFLKSSQQSLNELHNLFFLTNDLNKNISRINQLQPINE